MSILLFSSLALKKQLIFVNDRGGKVGDDRESVEEIHRYGTGTRYSFHNKV
jgi:hypothetical protein